jgi:hypothetical protein
MRYQAEREAHLKDRADLLPEAQVQTGLRFPAAELLDLLGGQEAVFESPLLQKLIAEKLQAALQVFLNARFGPVPRDVTRLLRKILDERKLRKLNLVAAKCSDREVFRKALLPKTK